MKWLGRYGSWTETHLIFYLPILALFYAWFVVVLLPSYLQVLTLGLWAARFVLAAFDCQRLAPRLNNALPSLFWWLVPGGAFYWLACYYYTLVDLSQKRHSFSRFWSAMFLVGWLLPLDIWLTRQAVSRAQALADENPDYLPVESCRLKDLEPPRRQVVLLSLRLSLIVAIVLPTWWWFSQETSQLAQRNDEVAQKADNRRADLDDIQEAMQAYWSSHQSWPTSWSQVAQTVELNHYKPEDINPQSLTGQTPGLFLLSPNEQVLPSADQDVVIVWLKATCSNFHRLESRVVAGEDNQAALTFYGEFPAANIQNFFKVGCRSFEPNSKIITKF